jgi:hypothetical protein
MHQMGKAGDTEVKWDKDDPNSVDKARKEFKSLTDSGWTAFKTGPKAGNNAKATSFDPNEERYLMVRQLHGG